MKRELSIERRTPLPFAAGTVYDWHARPGALERLLPPWRRITLLHAGSLAEGSQAELCFEAGPLQFLWTAEHRAVVPNRSFEDQALRSPFERWRHQHHFQPNGEHASELVDRIDCVLPRGTGFAARWVERELGRVLGYRHAVTAGDLAMHGRVPERRLRIAVTGASGFLGGLLIPALTTGGHEVVRLVRRPAANGELLWDPAGAGLAPATLEGIDAVIHLAGENIARRWTAERRRRILESRRTGTRALAEAIAAAPHGPRVLISASAIGFYGDRGDELLTEESAAGKGFLPEVVRAWEAATEPASAAGVRVVRLRIGLPLSPAGGVLQRMLAPFRLGVGGRLGSGRQWMSWISADDLIGAVHHVLTRDVEGAVNAVAPAPVRNADFARELGRVLRRPALVPVPAALLRLLFGRMADETILSSARVLPERLGQTGYRFRHETLAAALAHELGKHA